MHCSVILIFLGILGFTDRSIAQTVVPNGGFEHWVVDSVPTNPAYPNGTFFHPVDWTSSSGDSVNDTSRSIFRSTDAHTGMYALGGKVIANDSIGPLARTWYSSPENGYAFPIGGSPKAFEGWYKLNSIGNDYLQIMLIFLNSNNNVPIAILTDSSTKSFYTHFFIPLPQEDSGSGIIEINVDNTRGILHPGTEFVIDDFALTSSAAVEQPNALSFGLEPNYPNPFPITTTIRYSLPEDNNVTLEIFNMLGELVWSLDQGRQSHGEHQVFFNAGHLSSGPYLCRLITASQGTSSQIIQLSH